MQAVRATEFGHRSCRFAGDQSRSGDFATLELFEGFCLRHADFLDLDAEAFEDIAHRVAGSATSCIEVDLETLQLRDRGDVGACDEMGLLIEELGNIDDLVFGLAHPFIRAAEAIENAGLRETDVDALKVAHIANISRA